MYKNTKKHIYTFGIPSSDSHISSGQLRIYHIFPQEQNSNEKTFFYSEEKQLEQIIRTLKNGIRFDLSEALNYLFACDNDSTDYIVSDSFATIDSILKCNLYELNSFSSGQSDLDFTLIEDLKDLFKEVLSTFDLDLLSKKFNQWFSKSPIKDFMEV